MNQKARNPETRIGRLAGAALSRSALAAGCALVAWLVIFGPPVAGRMIAFAPIASSTGGPAPARPRAARPAAEAKTLEMSADESLADALNRAGLDAEEAGAAATALADEFDIVNPHPGLALSLEVAPAAGGSGNRRLVSLSLSPTDEARLRLSRDADGVLRVGRVEAPVVAEPTMVQGAVEGSLYLSLVGKGITPGMAAQVAGLFGRRLDLARDIVSGDRFRLVFEQPRRAGGPAPAPPELVYAELTARPGLVRFYRAASDGAGQADFVDGAWGPSPAPLLLRTPVAGARLTSLFGPRLHPILGYSRMHQGVDFAAPTGSPVLAAGDGVVEEARWAGGYGRWLKIRHASGLETGYAHLSAWAVAITPGARVRQGQVVAYVGSTGLATGPHLHFEVFSAGLRVDPRAAERNGDDGRSPGDGGAFRARKASIDATVASLGAVCSGAENGSPCGG